MHDDESVCLGMGPQEHSIAPKVVSLTPHHHVEHQRLLLATRAALAIHAKAWNRGLNCRNARNRSEEKVRDS